MSTPAGLMLSHAWGEDMEEPQINNTNTLRQLVMIVILLMLVMHGSSSDHNIQEYN